MKPSVNDFLPLAPATLHILLSLAGEKMYGYGIMQEVARQSEGRFKLGPGTLYDNLQRLMKRGLVEEIAGRSDEDNSRRRYYRLSGLGRGVLTAEIDRLREVIFHAEAHLKSLRPRRA
jgi:DNA-binding PadR family transcriptional regulator